MDGWKALVLVGMFAFTSSGAAQGLPFTGSGTVRLQAMNTALLGETLRVRVTVDLTGVTGLGPAGTPIPAALGAYVVPVRFDKKVLQFADARPGSAAGYTQLPKQTSPTVAAGLGEVTIAAPALSSSKPTGAVIIAELRFLVLRDGGTTNIEVVSQTGTTSLSAASAYFATGTKPGPALLPAKAGAALNVAIPAPVSAMTPLPAILLLILLSATVALVVRRRKRRARFPLSSTLIALLAGATPAGSVAPFIGDLNLSGATDGTDVILLEDYLVGNAAALQSARVDLGDMDGNARIDAVDLALLQAFKDQAHPLRPLVEISASPNPVPNGQITTLTWSSTRATSVSINGGPAGAPSGSAPIITANLPAVYMIVATGGGGKAKSEVAIGKQSTFTLQTVPTTLQVPRGTLQQTSFAYYVVRLASGDGFEGQAQLSAEGLPAGVTAEFSPRSITPGASADLKLSVASTTVLNTFNFTVRAQGSSAGVPLNVTLTRSFTVLGAGTYTSGRIMTSDPVPVPIVGAVITFLDNANIDATTDQAGNYLFTSPNTPLTGQRVIKIDTRNATSPTGSDFTFVHKSIPVVASQPNPMPMPFLMPRINTADGITPPLDLGNCVNGDIVFRSQSVPGLEVLLRDGTCLRRFGAPGTTEPRISVTRLDVDRFPGLLPGVDADSVYTLQPEGTTASIPVEVTYPNLRHMSAGTQVDLYALDIDQGMFVEIGTGTVSADGLQVVPDPDPSRPGYRYGLDHLTWSLSEALVEANNLGGPAQCEKCPAADPVELTNGIAVMDWVDLEVRSGTGRAAVQRTYRTRSIEKGPWGKGTSSNIDMVLVPGGPDPSTMQQVTLRLPGGRDRVFTNQGGGVFKNVSHPSSIGDKITGSLASGLLEIEFASGETWGFEGLTAGPPSGRLAGRIRFQFDRNGNDTRIQRTINGFPTRILEPGGRFIDIQWNEAAQGGQGLVTKLTDTLGRQVLYTYDASERLKTVTDANGKVWTYAWDAAGLLKNITNPRGFLMMENSYDARGRVTSQKRADAGVYTFAYTTSNPMDPNTTVVGTTTTDPMGHKRSYRFTASGFVAEVVDELGNKTVYARDPLTNQIATMTDPLGRVTAYTYDPKNGLPETITDPNGGVTTYEYDPRFALPTSIQDPNGNTITVEYDGSGNPITVSNPLGQSWTATYNGDGLMTSSTDPDDNTTHFAYSSSGDLIEAKDGVGNATRFGWDRAGRLSEYIDPLNQTTRFLYDGADRVTTRLFPGGANETFSYDAVGNLVATQDAVGNDWTMTYDRQNRLDSVTDPLGHQEHFTYDMDDLMLSFVDRRGKSTTQAYDARHLRTQVHPADGSTLSFQYDAAGRLTRADDSLTEPVDLQYDALNNLIAEVTPSGIVKSAFDASSRRIQLQVGNDTPVAYLYDPNSVLLSQIVQGAETYTFGYDASSRLKSVARPNGVNTEYTYDAADRIVRILHKMGATTLEDITYSNDLRGRPDARTSLLPTLSPKAFHGIYSVANHLAFIGEQALQYDENGNVLSDGKLDYTYDDRNRLVAATGPGVIAEFAYDAIGRRISKTINSTTTRYLYDRQNVVQERVGIASPINILSAGVDTWLARAAPDNTTYLLQDRLGSVVAETDASGVLRTSYSYDPFGRGETAGSASSNSFRFTGREDDGGGLYYYRARYFRPELQRFLAEDPIRLDSATFNFYAYVENGPTDKVDPLGLTAADARLFELYRADLAAQEIQGAEPVGSALKSDPWHRSAAFVQDQAAQGKVCTIHGNLPKRNLTQVPGEVNGVPGRFEWIVNNQGELTHQMFVRGGTINGIPITP